MLTLSELSELLERNRRRERLNDQVIAAAARLQSDFDRMIEEMRANNYRVLATRRDDLQKDYDDEESGFGR